MHAEVQETPHAGRTLVASEDLAAGTVVLRNAPSAIAVNDAFCDLHCTFCLQRAATRCTGCSLASFCKHCAADAVRQQQHKWECAAYADMVQKGWAGAAPAGAEQPESRFVRLLLRVLQAQSEERDTAVGRVGKPKDRSPPKEAPSSEAGSILRASMKESDDESILVDSPFDVDSLCAHAEDMDAELSMLLQVRAQQAKQLVPAASRRSFDYYYHTLCRLYCNVFGIGVSSASTTLAGKSWHCGGSGAASNAIFRELGLVLYVSAAMTNHSCDPNCRWSTGSSLHALDSREKGICTCAGQRGLLPIQEIRTLRAASKGSELLISYVMLRMSGTQIGGKKRRRQLRAGFFFDCRCEVGAFFPCLALATDSQRCEAAVCR